MLRLTLRNYRGFTEKTVELNKVNLLIGRNNTGKSAILEALALASAAPSLSDPMGYSLVWQILQNRGPPYSLKGFIKTGSDTSEVELVDGERKYRLHFGLDTKNETLKKRIESTADTEKVQQALGLFISMIGALADTKLPEPPAPSPKEGIYIECRSEGKEPSKETAHYFEADIYNMRSTKHVNDPSQLPASKTVYVSDPILGTFEYTARLLDFMVKENYYSFKKVLQRYTTYGQEYGIEDIRTLRPDGVCAVVNGKCQPLSFLGTGFKLSLLRELLTFSAKTIILDEPENYMHPGLVREFIKTLNQIKGDHTLMIASHSYDLLDSITQYIDEKSLTVFQLRPKEELIKIPGDEAKKRVQDIGEDLRDV